MNVKEELGMFLQNNKILSLATTDGQEISVCNLHYYADNEFNLYFVYKPETKHCENIIKHPNVAVCIYAPDHLSDTVISGIQLKGTCSSFEILDAIVSRKEFYNRFPKKLKGEITEFAENLDFRSFYKIQPKWVRFVDGRSRDFQHELML